MSFLKENIPSYKRMDIVDQFLKQTETYSQEIWTSVDVSTIETVLALETQPFLPGTRFLLIVARPTPNPTPPSTLNPTPPSTLNPTPPSTLNPTPPSTLNPSPPPTPNPSPPPTPNPSSPPTPNPSLNPT